MIVILSARPCAVTFAVTLPPDTSGCADLDVRAFADHQDLVELDGVAYLGLELLDANTLALRARYCLPPVRKTAYTWITPGEAEGSAGGTRRRAEILEFSAGSVNGARRTDRAGPVARLRGGLLPRQARPDRGIIAFDASR